MRKVMELFPQFTSNVKYKQPHLKKIAKITQKSVSEHCVSIYFPGVCHHISKTKNRKIVFFIRFRTEHCATFWLCPK